MNPLLLLHQFFVLDTEPGGTRHLFLLRHFQARGMKVRVIAGSVNYMTGRSRFSPPRLYRREHVDGIEILWVYALPFLKYGLLGKIACYLSFFALALPPVLAERPDLLIATSPPPTVAALGWLLSRLKRIPWIFEVRDLWPEMARDLGLGSRWILRPLFYLTDRVMRFLYRQASFVVSLTFGLRQHLLEQGLSPERVGTVPNGVDPIFVSAEALSPSPLAKEGKFRVMYVGSMGMANRVESILEIARVLKENPKVEFVLAGDGPLQSALRKKAAMLALDNVRMLGPVPRNQVPALLSTADVCLLTHAQTDSFRALLPNRLFDYMAAGCPVILCLLPGDASAVLEEAGGGIRVNPGDPEAAGKAILHYLEHPEEAGKAGQSGQAYVFKHFRREALAEKYLEIIQARMRSRGGTSPA